MLCKNGVKVVKVMRTCIGGILGYGPQMAGADQTIQLPIQLVIGQRWRYCMCHNYLNHTRDCGNVANSLTSPGAPAKLGNF